MAYLVVFVQDGDCVGLSGGEGLNTAIQLKQKLLEFDQTRYVWNERHVCAYTLLTISGMVCYALAAACVGATNGSVVVTWTRP